MASIAGESPQKSCTFSSSNSLAIGIAVFGLGSGAASAHSATLKRDDLYHVAVDVTAHGLNAAGPMPAAAC